MLQIVDLVNYLIDRGNQTWQHNHQASPANKVIMLSNIRHIRDFNRFYTNVLGLLNDRILDSPVSLTEARVLLEIKERPHSKAKDLMEVLCIDRGYLSRLLAKLEKRGWVVKEVPEQDRRARALNLSRAGQDLVAELERRSESQLERIIAPLSAKERAELIHAMERIKSLLS
jgi:DNA-binding MarR family transcriptional regulator